MNIFTTLVMSQAVYPMPNLIRRAFKNWFWAEQPWLGLCIAAMKKFRIFNPFPNIGLILEPKEAARPYSHHYALVY